MWDSPHVQYTVLLPQLQQDIQVRSNESQREGRKKDKLERELRQAKADLETKTAETKTLQGQMERYKQDITKTEQQLKEQRVGWIYDFHGLVGDSGISSVLAMEIPQSCTSPSISEYRWD